MKRYMNILSRAMEECAWEPVMNCSFESNVVSAEETLVEELHSDRVEIVDDPNRHDHIDWNDGKEYEYSADGEFISLGSKAHNTYYRRTADGWLSIGYWAVQDGDYVVMATVVDSDAQVVELVALVP